MRALIIVLACIALGSCNAIFHATLPLSDIIRLANAPFSFTQPIQARVMIELDGSVSCEQGKEVIMPVLERYGYNVRYKGCAELDQFWENQVQIAKTPYSFIHVDMSVDMTQSSNISDIDPEGLFGIGFTPMENGRTDLFFITTERLERAENEIRWKFNTPFYAIKKISIVFENDTDEEIGFEFGPARVDRAEVSRGERIMLPSNRSLTLVPLSGHVEELTGENPESFASVFVAQ